MLFFVTIPKYDQKNEKMNGWIDDEIDSQKSKDIDSHYPYEFIRTNTSQ